ncbi:MAG: hypothetical protein LBU17_12740 [Treponema sp.]|nr:hypothetical protein [Treponema sp.]
MFILYPASGLPDHILKEWYQKSFSNFPSDLAHLREPKSKAAADNAAMALIEYLKEPRKTDPLVPPSLVKRPSSITTSRRTLSLT